MTKDIIKNMSVETRRKAEAYAAANGISLDEAVASQLGSELSDSDLDSVAGGATEYSTEYVFGNEYNTETSTKLD